MAPQPLKSKSFLLACFSALLLLPAGAMPLMETTEARYAEIAREMIVSGNYLEPYFNAIKHFHKPPLAYWLVAAGLKTFGFNNFGARFFWNSRRDRCGDLRLSLRLSVSGQRQGRPDSRHYFCVVTAVSDRGATGLHGNLPGGLRGGCAVLPAATDLRTARPEQRPLVWSLAGTGIYDQRTDHFPVYPAAGAGRQSDRQAPPQHLQLAANPCSMRNILRRGAPLVSPGYRRESGLLAYFLKVQTVDRVVTDRFRRYEPPWYFFYIFAATFFPYILFFGKGLWRWKNLSSELKTLLLYVALPMLIFTIAKGKHATYILPFYGSCAILTAAMLNRDPMPRLRDATAAILLVFAVAPAIAGFAYAPLRSNMAPLLGSALVLLALWWMVWKSCQRETFWTGTALLMLLFSTVAIVSVGIAGPNMRGYQQMAAAMNRIDPQKKLTTLIYHGFLPSVSFYRNQLAVMSFSDQRETQFQPEASYRPWYVTTESELTPILAENPKLFVVVRKQEIEDFTTQHAYRCSPVFQQRKHSAYLCQASPP